MPGMYTCAGSVLQRDHGGKNKIHIVEQEKCTKCGTCFEVCPPRFRAVTKLSAFPFLPQSLKRKELS